MDAVLDQQTRPRLSVFAACLVVLVALPVTFGPAGEGTGIDSWSESHLRPLAADHHALLSVLCASTTLQILLPVVAVAVLLAARSRRWRDVSLLIMGPVVAVLTSSFVLKPIYDRHYNGHLVYPSGHTVSLVAVATALVLVVHQVRVRVVLAVAASVLLALAAVGMIGLGYHHLTDIVGGIATGIGVVVAVAVALDRVPW